MFANLKISLKLTALIGFLLIALISVGAFGGYALRGAQGRSAENLQQARDMLRAVDVARAAEVAYKIQIQEFKNVLLRGHDQKDYDNYLASFNKRGDMVHRELLDVRERMIRIGVPTASADDAIAMQRDIGRTYLDGLKQFDVARPESTQTVDKLVRGKDRPLEAKIEAVVDALQKHSELEATRIVQTSAAQSSRVMGIFSVIIAVAVVASIVAGALVSRSITGPVGAAVSAARRVADGDLTVRIQPGGRNETGQLLEALADMTQNLRTLVGEVAGGAHTVSDTSAQIAQGNVDLSQRTEEQASTLEETASSMEELTTTVTQNAQNARQASRLAVGASEVARKGGQVVGQVVSTMSGISESSRKISDIVSVIDGIAFQTNILALNAAVEAARAGEQGRGFAVVAAEVRNLAQRSASAAKEIKTLIGDSVDKVDAGTKLVDAAGKTMDEIVGSVKQVTDLISDIASASQEQSAGIEQINTAIMQMDQVVQQNASLVEEATAATESMNEQAGSLLKMVSKFKLDGGLGSGADAVMQNTAPGTASGSMSAPLPIRVRDRQKSTRIWIPAPTRTPLAGARQLDGSGRTSDMPNSAWKEF